MFTGVSEVRQAINRNVLIVSPDTPLIQVIERMNQRRSLMPDEPQSWAIADSPKAESCSQPTCALVMASAQLLGIFTSQDVIQAVASKCNLEETTISEVMTTPVVTLNLADLKDASVVLDVMRQYQIHHLPILDEQQQLLGVATCKSLLCAGQNPEVALHRSEEQRSLALDMTQLGTWDWDMTTGSLTWTDNTFRLLGFAPGEVEPTQAVWRQRVHPEDLEGIEQATLRDLEGQGPGEVEYRVVHPDGSLHWLLGKGKVVHDQDGKPVRMLGILMDISDRKAAKEQLRQQQQLTEQIAESTAAILYIYDLVENCNVYANSQIEAVLGYSPDEVQALGNALFSTLVHPEDFPTQMVNYQHCFTLKDGEILETAYRMRHKQGEYRWLLSRDRVLNRMPDGSPRQILGVATDITLLKETQVALQHQADRERLMATISQRIRQSLNLEMILATTVGEVRQLLRTDRVILYRFDPDWSGIVVAESVAEAWSPILNLKITDTYFVATQGQSYQQGTIRAIDDVQVAGLDPCHLALMEQLQVRAKLIVPVLQGRCVWGLLIAHHCAAPRSWHPWEKELLSQLATQVGIAIQQANLYRQAQHELAERRQTEQALRLSQARFAGILDVASDAIISIDSNQRVTLYNQGAEKMFGYPADEVLGQPLDLLLPKRFVGMHRHHVRDFAQGEAPARRMGERQEIFARRQDGREFPAEASISRLTLAGETILTVILRDVSDRKRAEAKLREQQAQLDLVVQASNVGFYLSDLQTNTSYVSPAYKAQLGYAAEEESGSPADWNSRLHPEDRDRAIAAYQAFKRQEAPYNIDFRLRHRDGSYRWIYSNAQLILDDRGCPAKIVGTHIDITDRKQAEAALQQLNRDLEWRVQERTEALQQQADQEQLLRFVAQRIHQSLDLEEILITVLTEIRHTLQADRVAIYRFNPDWSGTFVAESVDTNWVPLVGPDIQTVWPDTYLQETQGGRYRQGETFAVNDIYTIGHSPCHVDILEQFQIRAYAIAPILVQDHLWGLLAAYHNAAPHQWQAREINLLLQISLQTEIAIQQSDLFQQVQMNLAVKGLLVEIAETINRSVQFDQALTDILKRIQQFLGCDRAIVYRLLPDGRGVIEEEATSQPELSLLGQIIDDPCLSRDYAKRYEQGYITLLNDRETADLRPCYLEFLAQLQIRANLVVPILQAETLWGLLILHQCHTPRQWQLFEIDLLQQVGLQIGIAGQKAALYAQLENELHQKEVLIREVHHRVKNNLQVISSLLYLQSATIENPDILQPFIESQHRIDIMAMIHERLYRSGNLANLNFASYVRDLVEDVFQSYLPIGASITWQVKVAELELELDIAIPCGLIINELVSNAIKYAFPNRRSGEIGIIFDYENSQYQLIIRDNGIGFPQLVDFRNTESLGMQVVCALTRQLGGSIELNRDGGTAFAITF
ncbi:hypothetical protein BST81_03825 [Leptolyngbya sp. 'hensonii']|uniref:GAF domain-containing protein n=1 Tax=Leptolyngbya sp. 'hensonii' TaxID=1922337 RepID=UPI00094FFF2A|nr:GAF domain-containing protein [Leptolyngbya sp. 'hensonii']OLP19681.1 hypothetical protein BST81_03825 [Leptolyngbya sp. 'hensonii']